MDLEKAVKLYSQGMSVPEINKKYGFNTYKLYKELKEKELTRSHREKSLKYKCNEDYFNKIDNQKKAYWLGYMCADGYITKTKYGYVSAVTSKDGDHLELFKQDLESTHEVKKYSTTTSYGNTEYYRLLITSKQLFYGLKNNGCVENKSKILLPPNIDKNLERHWIRGYYDGDGSIRKRPQSKSGFSLSVLGTEQVVSWINNYINGSFWYDSIKDIWYLDTTITLEILDFLYDNADRHLERKFDRAVLARKRLLGTS